MEKYTYTEIKNEDGKVTALLRSDGASVPCDPANSDYQRYLNPEAEHFTPKVATK